MFPLNSENNLEKSDICNKKKLPKFIWAESNFDFSLLNSSGSSNQHTNI